MIRSAIHATSSRLFGSVNCTWLTAHPRLIRRTKTNGICSTYNLYEGRGQGGSFADQTFRK